jgi:thiol:disulfide interchange protein DsbD
MGVAIFTSFFSSNFSNSTYVAAGMFSSLGNFFQALNGIDAEHVQALAVNHIGFALALCFVSGILTSLTPCVYPMIPITINIFGRMSREDDKKNAFNKHSFMMAGIYVAGMCFTYSVMGIAAGLSGSLFGKLLQSSFTLGFLTLLFLILALGQWGLFKLALPASWQTRAASIGHGNSVVGIFLMGLFSGLIISPCVGPVIAGILAFVFNTSNAFLGLLYFFSFSLGLGVLFLLIGGFSGLLNQLPRSGLWMTRVNRILAALMLIAAAYYGILFLKKVGVLARSIPTVATQNGIAWMNDETAARKLSAEKHLPMMIDFTAEWCEACHELEKIVFQDPNVIAKAQSFIALRLDFTEDTPANRTTSITYGVISLPTISFVTPTGKVLEQPRVNGVVSPEDFMKNLDAATQASSQ